MEEGEERSERHVDCSSVPQSWIGRTADGKQNEHSFQMNLHLLPYMY